MVCQNKLSFCQTPQTLLLLLLLLQYNLRLATTECADASRRADEATMSHDSIRKQHDEAQAVAREAATAAARDVSSTQVVTTIITNQTPQ